MLLKLQRMYRFFCEPLLGFFGSSVHPLFYHTAVCFPPSCCVLSCHMGRGVVGKLQMCTILNWALVAPITPSFVWLMLLFEGIRLLSSSSLVYSEVFYSSARWYEAAVRVVHSSLLLACSCREHREAIVFEGKAAQGRALSFLVVNVLLLFLSYYWLVEDFL